MAESRNKVSSNSTEPRCRVGVILKNEQELASGGGESRRRSLAISLSRREETQLQGSEANVTRVVPGPLQVPNC